MHRRRREKFEIFPLLYIAYFGKFLTDRSILGLIEKVITVGDAIFCFSSNFFGSSGKNCPFQKFWNTGTNEMSETNEILLFDPPLHVTGACRPSLKRHPNKVRRLHIFKASEFKDSLK